MTDRNEQSRRNRQLVRRFHDRVIVASDWNAARDLLHPDVTHQRGAIGLTLGMIDPDGVATLRGLAGPERFIEATKVLRRAFTRWDSEIVEIVADGPIVMMRAVVHARLDSEFLDGGSGAEATIEQAVRFRCSRGRITEIWAMSDQLAVWRDLGASLPGSGAVDAVDGAIGARTQT